MASHRFFVFVISRRKPRSNHHWLMLATKLTLGLDHSLAQKQNVSAIFLRHPIAIVIFCAQNRVSFLRAVAKVFDTASEMHRESSPQLHV